MKRLLILLSVSSFAFTSYAQKAEKIDADMMQKIRKEGLENSKVMDIAFQLTDASGPRLTASPGYIRASNYAKKQLSDWGLQNAMLDPWGEFGKGWELEKNYLAMTAPYYRPIIAYTKAWTAGTNGLKSAELMLVSAKDSIELASYQGKLAGKIILFERTDSYKQSFKADANRYADTSLQKMTDAKPRDRNQQPTDTAEARKRRENMARLQLPGVLLGKLREMARKEGAVAIVTTNPRNHDGTVFVQQGGPYKVTDPENFLDLAIAYEDFMPMQRLLKAGTPVKLEVEVKTRFITDDTKAYNVIAEIKGTDKNLKEEVVMLGGHLDCWQGATGATDNAAGSAVMMEAVRILQAVGAKPRRTIRIALWSGEEQGILGSRAYVKKTFADPATMELLPAHEKFSAYFNLDNGTGKIRGIYLQGNDSCRSIFSQWFAPFNDLGAGTITISNTGGTDHLSFDAVGLPGFQFIQDEIEYDTRTHHSNMDSYDHLIGDDLKQAATIIAAFVYDAAMRDEKLPRKELPKPRPANN